MMRLLMLMLVCTVVLGACSRTPMPEECRDLSAFMREQQAQLGTMRSVLESGGGNAFHEVATFAHALERRQTRVLEACEAEAVARGPTCLQFHQVGDINTVRSDVRTIGRLAGQHVEAPDPAVVLGFVDTALATGLREHSQSSCK